MIFKVLFFYLNALYKHLNAHFSIYHLPSSCECKQLKLVWRAMMRQCLSFCLASLNMICTLLFHELRAYVLVTDIKPIAIFPISHIINCKRAPFANFRPYLGCFVLRKCKLCYLLARGRLFFLKVRMNLLCLTHFNCVRQTMNK